MNNKLIKVKKGGLDTIVAYIVVSLPLLYVLIYMVATIYHFSVQTFVTQIVRETAVMISTYGAVTTNHEKYINDELGEILGVDGDGNTRCSIVFYRREFDDDKGIVEKEEDAERISALTLDEIKNGKRNLDKGDIVGVYVESLDQSMLGSVGAFSIFGPSSNASDLHYSAFREEIVRNERPN